MEDVCAARRRWGPAVLRLVQNRVWWKSDWSGQTSSWGMSPNKESNTLLSCRGKYSQGWKSPPVSRCLILPRKKTDDEQLATWISSKSDIYYPFPFLLLLYLLQQRRIDCAWTHGYTRLLWSVSQHRLIIMDAYSCDQAARTRRRVLRRGPSGTRGGGGPPWPAPGPSCFPRAISHSSGSGVKIHTISWPCSLLSPGSAVEMCLGRTQQESKGGRSPGVRRPHSGGRHGDVKAQRTRFLSAAIGVYTHVPTLVQRYSRNLWCKN